MKKYTLLISMAIIGSLISSVTAMQYGDGSSQNHQHKAQKHARKAQKAQSKGKMKKAQKHQMKAQKHGMGASGGY